MDDERLKNPPVGSSVLERIRDIHASMRRVYLQVIYIIRFCEKYRVYSFHSIQPPVYNVIIILFFLKLLLPAFRLFLYDWEFLPFQFL